MSILAQVGSGVRAGDCDEHDEDLSHGYLRCPQKLTTAASIKQILSGRGKNALADAHLLIFDLK